MAQESREIGRRPHASDDSPRETGPLDSIGNNIDRSEVILYQHIKPIINQNSVRDSLRESQQKLKLQKFEDALLERDGEARAGGGNRDEDGGVVVDEGMGGVLIKSFSKFKGPQGLLSNVVKQRTIETDAQEGESASGGILTAHRLDGPGRTARTQFFSKSPKGKPEKPRPDQGPPSAMSASQTPREDRAASSSLGPAAGKQARLNSDVDHVMKSGSWRNEDSPARGRGDAGSPARGKLGRSDSPAMKQYSQYKPQNRVHLTKQVLRKTQMREVGTETSPRAADA